MISYMLYAVNTTSKNKPKLQEWMPLMTDPPIEKPIALTPEEKTELFAMAQQRLQMLQTNS